MSESFGARARKFMGWYSPEEPIDEFDEFDEVEEVAPVADHYPRIPSDTDQHPPQRAGRGSHAHRDDPPHRLL